MTQQALIHLNFIEQQALTQTKLQVAQTVQQSMLPQENKPFQKAKVAWYYQPMEQVGGDWFHLMESPDGQELYVMMGDVTGHGVATGLVTTAVAGVLHTLEQLTRNLSAFHFDPAQLVSLLDQLLLKIAGKSQLRMTCVAAKIHVKQACLEVCNAGHTFPLLLRTASSQASAPAAKSHARQVQVKALVKNQQPMLGEYLESPHHYTNASYTFEPQDMLMFYTDGLTEATNQAGKAFQRTFMRYLLRQSLGDSPQHIKQELLQLWQQHTQGQELKDDVCLLILKF